MDATIPFWSHWYFHLPTYALAMLFYTLLGRFMFSLFVPHDWPNYIWRGFRLITDWAVAGARVLAPRVVPDGLLPLVAAFWAMAARVAFSVTMVTLDLAPRLQPAAS
ncbi:MAG: hypothetical protein RLY86_1396 [Pseudomonadota bacterium]|jgi:hypothetical protein